MGCKGSYSFGGGKGFKGYKGGWKKFSKDFTKSKSWEKKAWKSKACDKRDDDTDFDFGGGFGGGFGGKFCGFKKGSWKKDGWAKKSKKWGCDDDKKEIKIAVCFDRNDNDDHGKGWGKGHYKKWWKKKGGCEQPEIEEPVDTNEAPVITSPSNDEPLLVTPGMTGIVAAVQATDADNDTLEFIIDDTSEDANLFEIDAATGLISLLGEATPNNSADGDSSYEITVEVSDGQATDTIDLIFDLYTGA